MSTSDRFNIQSQTEHMQMKYTGTGHADTTKFEWLVNQHRDSYTSYLGHPSLHHYFAIAQNQSLGRVRYQMLQKMAKPCGDEKDATTTSAVNKQENQSEA